MLMNTDLAIANNMKAIYKKCENCDGQGYFPTYPTYPYPSGGFTGNIQSYYIIDDAHKCGVCNGTGRIFWGYIEEPTANIESKQ